MLSPQRLRDGYAAVSPYEQPLTCFVVSSSATLSHAFHRRAPRLRRTRIRATHVSQSEFVATLYSQRYAICCHDLDVAVYAFAAAFRQRHVLRYTRLHREATRRADART